MKRLSALMISCTNGLPQDREEVFVIVSADANNDGLRAEVHGLVAAHGSPGT